VCEEAKGLIASSISTFAPTFLSFSVYFYIRRLFVFFFNPKSEKTSIFRKKTETGIKTCHLEKRMIR